MDVVADLNGQQFGKCGDLTGMRFGMLTVIDFAGVRTTVGAKRTQRHAMWNCMCDCGESKAVSSVSLASGGTTSCGCRRGRRQDGRKLIDLTGHKFGKLTVVKRLENRITKSGYSLPLWLCECECGHSVEVLGMSLREGQRSCKHCCGYIYTAEVMRAAYEKAYGAIPAGHMVTPLDGDCNNIEPNNLVAMSRADYNRLHNRGLAVVGNPDLKLAAIQALALERAVRKIEQSL